MKRKNLQHLKIKAQQIKPQFEHEKFAAGFPPYGKGITPTYNIKTLFSEANEAEFITVNYDKNIAVSHKLSKIIATTFIMCKERNKNPFIKIQLTESFTDNIAFIRALRILWSKLVIKKAKDFDLVDNLKIIIELNSDDLNANLSNTLSAIGGSVQHISFSNEISKNEIDSFKNYFLNDFEDKSIIDPYAGSILIEEKTEVFSINSWNIFTENTFDFEKILQL